MVRSGRSLLRQLLATLLAVWTARFWDLGQCNRSCRVVHGSGHPEVLGQTGSWNQAGIIGRRRMDAWGTCNCWSADSDGKKEAVGDVPFYHEAIATQKQFWFNTDAVCGADGADYASAAAARESGTTVVNCGQCGACSTPHDTFQLHANSQNMTKLASVGALLFLGLGDGAHASFMQSSYVGLSEDCAGCWLQATQCNLVHCARPCLFGWGNPLSANNNAEGGGLNACLECDEIHCSAYYLQACGANRRTAGVVTDIGRPKSDVCSAAREDAFGRFEARGLQHPDGAAP